MFMTVHGVFICVIIPIQASGLLTYWWHCVDGWITFSPFGNVKSSRRQRELDLTRGDRF